MCVWPVHRGRNFILALYAPADILAAMAVKAHDHDLVNNIRAIKAEITRLQGLLDEASAELVRKDTPSAASQRAVAANQTRRERKQLHRVAETSSSELVPDSAAYLAAAAIRTAAKPLHAHDLVKAIEGQGHKVKETTLVGALSRWVKRRAVFYRAGKNTFGLIEMRK